MLHHAARDPAATAVLADWYEEGGEAGWAQWLRERPTPHTRRVWLGRQIRRVGGALRAPTLPLTGLEEPFLGPFLRSLSWTIRDPSRWDSLTRTPAFCQVRRLHLAGYRKRTALSRVLEAIAASNRRVEHLDIFEGTLPASLLNAWSPWDSLAARVDGPVTTSLPIRHLTLRIRNNADLEHWAQAGLPQLRTLTLLDEPGPLSCEAAAMEPLLRRPLERIWASRRLRDTLGLRVLSQFRIHHSPEPAIPPWTVFF